MAFITLLSNIVSERNFTRTPVTGGKRGEKQVTYTSLPGRTLTAYCADALISLTLLAVGILALHVLPSGSALADTLLTVGVMYSAGTFLVGARAIKSVLFSSK